MKHASRFDSQGPAKTAGARASMAVTSTDVGSSFSTLSEQSRRKRKALSSVQKKGCSRASGAVGLPVAKYGFGLRCGVYGLWFMVYGLWFMVSGFGFRVSGFGCRL